MISLFLPVLQPRANLPGGPALGIPQRQAHVSLAYFSGHNEVAFHPVDGKSLDHYRVSDVATPRTFTAKHHIGNFLLQPVVVLNGHWVPLRWAPQHESDILKEFQ